VDSARRKDWRRRGLLKAVRGAPRGLVVKVESLAAEAKVRREVAERAEVGARPKGRSLVAEAMWRAIDAAKVCDVAMPSARQEVGDSTAWELSKFYDGVASDSGPPSGAKQQEPPVRAFAFLARLHNHSARTITLVVVTPSSPLIYLRIPSHS
jgi:hypothetical protein